MDDITLLRFCAADKWDVDKGLARLLKTIQWRKEINVDNLVMNPPKLCKKLVRTAVAIRKRGNGAWALATECKQVERELAEELVCGQCMPIWHLLVLMSCTQIDVRAPFGSQP